MPAKRQATSNGSSPTKSKRTKPSDADDASASQRRLDTFFKSPNKSLTTEITSVKRSTTPSKIKGKGKAVVPDVITIDSDSDVPMEVEAPTRSFSVTRQAGADKDDAELQAALRESLAVAEISAAGPSRLHQSRNSSPTTPTTSVPPATPQPKQGLSTLPTNESPDPFPDLTCDPLEFDVSQCPWVPGKGAPYSFLAHAFVSLSATRSRILLTNTLVNTLREILRHDSKALLATLYLLSNSITPAYEPVEMNIGPSIISKALQSVSGLSNAALRKLYNSCGDAGDVAFEAKSSVRTLIPHPPLLIQGVYDSLLRIANSKGNGAAKQKQSIIEKLLLSAKGEEVRYLVRTFVQHIRVGAVRTTMLTGLARALVLTRPPAPCPEPPPPSEIFARKELIESIQPLPTKKKKDDVKDTARERIKEMFINAESLLKRVFVQHPNYGHVITAVLQHGFEALAEHVPLTVGVPLHPTLGSPTRSLDEIYDRLGNLPFAAEFKYDGQRAQIHASRNPKAGAPPFIRLFSRHLEDMTEKYPDILLLIQSIFDRAPDIASFIIDSEIVAVDPVSGDIKSFQELSNRPKKDVNIKEVKVVVCVYVFDLMYYNAQILLEEPFRKRRDLLRTNFPPFTAEDKYTARLDHVESCESSEGKEAVEDFFQSAVLSKSEGLMIKLLDSGEVTEEIVETVKEPGSESPKKKARSNRKPLPATYEPDKRTSAWLKLKKDYVAGLGDSFDLVPVGAWHGNGRKAKWWSPVLLAIWDSKKDCLVAVCKCMSGFTDAFYQAMADRYKEGSETCSKQPFKGVECDYGDLRPSVFFKPTEVWELQGADITISPRSVAALGLVSDQRGLSIRFPRFIKIREDKHIEDATGPEFLADLYRKQEGRNGKTADTGGLDDGDLIDADLEEEDTGSEEEEDM